jgi:hypothetical protein
VGKPRTRWEDITWTDTSQILGIWGWKRQVEDREVQRHLLRESRAQKRLKCRRWNRICNSCITGAYKKDVWTEIKLSWYTFPSQQIYYHCYNNKETSPFLIALFSAIFKDARMWYCWMSSCPLQRILVPSFTGSSSSKNTVWCSR